LSKKDFWPAKSAPLPLSSDKKRFPFLKTQETPRSFVIDNDRISEKSGVLGSLEKGPDQGEVLSILWWQCRHPQDGFLANSMACTRINWTDRQGSAPLIVDQEFCLEIGTTVLLKN
jgi:hypothetical protein